MYLPSFAEFLENGRVRRQIHLGPVYYGTGSHVNRHGIGVPVAQWWSRDILPCDIRCRPHESLYLDSTRLKQ